MIRGFFLLFLQKKFYEIIVFFFDRCYNLFDINEVKSES